MPSTPPRRGPAAALPLENLNVSPPPVISLCESSEQTPEPRRKTSKPAKRLNVRTRTPLKRYVPATDPRRAPDRRHDNKKRRRSYQDNTNPRPRRTSSSRPKGSTAVTKLSASTCSAVFYMNPHNSSGSRNSDSTVTEVSRGHTPIYDPAAWEVLTDADSLNTAYETAVSTYSRQVTAKLAKKREREKGSQKS